MNPERAETNPIYAAEREEYRNAVETLSETERGYFEDERMH